MTLEDIGFNEAFKKSVLEKNLQDFEIGRVIMQHKDRYIVLTESGEKEAEITGNLRFTARTKEDFPAVGDWVAIIGYDENSSIIQQVLPRFSILKRQAAGQYGEVQIIAANIDFALLVQAVDRDFNVNRLERYLTICHVGKVKPLIVLTKTDLIEQEKKHKLLDTIKSRMSDIPHFAISNLNKDGYSPLIREIKKGKTYCLLGSSGVGKSTLLNNLSGNVEMKTGDISTSSQRGRHITTHREIIILPGGGILIDNPGMREVGIADQEEGLETTFDQIIRLSKNCKYKDCTHTKENGCAVLEALEKGDLDSGAYENYMRMQREKLHFNLSVHEKRKKDRDFGKMIKNYKKR